jgi:hypothetical protein
LRRYATAFTVATAGLAATAASAQAATVGFAPGKACYLSGEEVTVSGTGYTPMGFVDISIDGRSLGQLQADAAGAVTSPLRLGGFKGAKTHTVTATDVTNAALVGTAPFSGTTFQVTVKPKHARAGKKLKLRGYGFLSGPNAYMHVRGHGYTSDSRVGKSSGPCGQWSAKRRIVPASAASGKYKVQFDHKRKFSKKTKPRLRGTMTVTRTFSSTGFGGAAPLYAWTQVG